MTLNEYWLRLEASQIKKVERQEELAMQSWFNQNVQATTGGKKPRPKYKTFNKFFDSVGLMNDVHRTFNKDYVPIVESGVEKQKNEQDELIERMKKFQKMQEESS